MNLATYATAQDLLDAMTATARAQGRDRFFSYVTTRQADTSFLQEGEFVGFGFRIRVDGNRAFFLDAFESSPASEAGLARGAELLAVDSGSGYVPVATIIATDPNLSQAFGPSDVGVVRGLRFSRAGGPDIQATLTKRVVTITPIPTGGVTTMPLPSNPSVQVGYVNLRTYISTAETPLRNAFAGFRAQGIQDFIIDLRYNGGGLVSISDLLGDLFGRSRTTADVYSNLRFSARKASNDVTHRFAPQAQSVTPVRIAFITTGASASASEMTVNAMKSWAERGHRRRRHLRQAGRPVGLRPDRLRHAAQAHHVPRHQPQRGGRLLQRPGRHPALRLCRGRRRDATDVRPVRDLERRRRSSWLGTGACSLVMAPRLPGAEKLSPQDVESRYPVPERPSAAQLHLPGLF